MLWLHAWRNQFKFGQDNCLRRQIAVRLCCQHQQTHLFRLPQANMDNHNGEIVLDSLQELQQVICRRIGERFCIRLPRRQIDAHRLGCKADQQECMPLCNHESTEKCQGGTRCSQRLHLRVSMLMLLGEKFGTFTLLQGRSLRQAKPWHHVRLPRDATTLSLARCMCHTRCMCMNRRERLMWSAGIRLAWLVPSGCSPS